jgi:hypothetical protein
MENNRTARPWDIFNSNIKKVEVEIKSQRMDICNSCEHLIPAVKACTQCGCFMEAKTTLPHAECPIGKWGRVPISFKEEMK